MGMFDYVFSSYDLGEQFTNVVLHTKYIDDYYSGSMSDFWIDPKGYLWAFDYTGTSTFEEIKETDSRYDEKVALFNFEFIPTGNHGKCRVHPITKYIKVYPENWEGEWKDWPTLRLHFKHGLLTEFTDITHE
jgi:hypothetical protein